MKPDKQSFLFSLFISSLLIILCADKLSALSSEDRFYKAEACAKNLRNNPKKQKYRHNWIACIEKFQEVYQQDPSGPWAAAGLYGSGQLYLELYKRSYLKSDQKEALDIFERIVKRFPKSGYTKKAAAAVRTISATENKKKEVETERISASSSKVTEAKDKYIEAEVCYQRLLKNPKKLKYRENWKKCIERFESAYRVDPTGPWAAASLYMTGKLTHELYRHSYRTSDQQKALDILEDVVNRYPESDYYPKALSTIQKISPERAKELISVKKEDGQEKIETSPPDIPKTPSQQPDIASKISPSAEDDERPDIRLPDEESTIVTGLRFWSNPRYTRVVIDADRETEYAHHLLNQDPVTNKPRRLFVDLNYSRLGKEIQKFIPIHDNLLSNVRAGQYTPDSVRVVIDIKSSESYKIFSLKNPFRVVIDVWGAVEKKRAIPDLPEGGKVSPGALTKQLALGVRRIVIDPGHGGRDYGAPGYLKGVHEKNVILSIARRLAKKIREQIGCEVILTRERDHFLTLEERTAFANTKNADLFVSLHANSSTEQSAYGIETFFLNLATDDDAIMVAARENATSTKNISDLQTILNDLMQNTKINESSRLASHVQDSMCNHLKGRFSRIKNKGVKQAPFYVLLGAEMPSILIETSFISNRRECKRLIDSKYQDNLCEGIVIGIRKYIEETNPTAFAKDAANS